jgi:hypothetical protein
MDLQSQGSKPVTSENASPATTSGRIPHKQPTSAGANRTLRGACTLVRSRCDDVSPTNESLGGRLIQASNSRRFDASAGLPFTANAHIQIDLHEGRELVALSPRTWSGSSVRAPRECDQGSEIVAGVCMAQGRQVIGSKVGDGDEFGASPGERFGAQVGDEQVGGQA